MKRAAAQKSEVMRQKKLYLYTIGCQMNVYDADLMAAVLAQCQYRRTNHMDKADLIIVNTCSVREKAEQKLYSYLGRLADLKQQNPDLIIGVGGCVAQQEGENILKRVPLVDLVFGTRAIDRLPALVDEIERRGGRLVDTDMIGDGQPRDGIQSFNDMVPVSGFTTIMRGCDNYCTYCVVPYVRGREISRTPEEILSEIRERVAAGMREVTLLGQNVNSYGRKEGLCTFPELLESVNDIDGLKRIRFTTSHPKDLSAELISAFGKLDKLCNHIHLPVQSGSNRVLKRMNRKYTREVYVEKVEKLRRTRPDIAITSDMIVGFPGETSEDFEATLDLVREIGFDGLFAFAYSDRPNAPAAQFDNKIPDTVRKERLLSLLALQETYTRQKNEALLDNVVSVLVERYDKKQDPDAGADTPPAGQWTGRTSSNKIVHFFDSASIKKEKMIGSLAEVRIDRAFSHSLRAVFLKTVVSDFRHKGDKIYAA